MRSPTGSVGRRTLESRAAGPGTPGEARRRPRGPLRERAALTSAGHGRHTLGTHLRQRQKEPGQTLTPRERRNRPPRQKRRDVGQPGATRFAETPHAAHLGPAPEHAAPRTDLDSGDVVSAAATLPSPDPDDAVQASGLVRSAYTTRPRPSSQNESASCSLRVSIS
ncbi:hypothetical protein HPB47_010737 [Ixodes persulcatus]|uniref:Uncharacterized protein n=1 Tax=Ixodes persulcatus TaxID=34615 RepID=A0AC60NYA5_IXOPE|nr:hypothetical protein HPB47_010737 [Ixodes persulcatus]